MSYRTLINIFRQLIRFDNETITYIIDNDNNVWFTASAIANILEYSNKRQAIIDHVEAEDVMLYRDLKMYVDVVPHNAQDNTVYISEPGLYYLIFASHMPKARKFRRWILREVIPAIRKQGEYKLNRNAQQKIHKLNETVEELRNQVLVYKNNNKKRFFEHGGYIYIVRPIDSKDDLFKVGKTNNLKNRLKTYNTTVPNDIELLFYIKVDNIHAVEKCVKAVMDSYQYRHNKEYYECSLKTLKQAITSCNDLISKIKVYKIKDRKREKRKSLEDVSKDYNITPDEKLLVGMVSTKDFALHRNKN